MGGPTRRARHLSHVDDVMPSSSQTSRTVSNDNVSFLATGTVPIATITVTLYVAITLPATGRR